MRLLLQTQFERRTGIRIVRILSVLILVLSYVQSLIATDITWTGTNGSFATASNWNSNSVPTAADKAIFNDSPNYTLGYAVGITVPATVADVSFTATTNGLFWKLGTNTWTVSNSFVLDQAAGATAVAALQQLGVLAVTNTSGTAVFKVGNYTSGGKGLFTMQKQGTDSSDVPTLITDSFRVTSNSVFTFNAGTLTTLHGATIDRGTNATLQLAASGTAADKATWNMLGGTNTITYLGTVGTNMLGFSTLLNVNVANSNTVWNVGGNKLAIGWNGSANLVISNGARVSSPFTMLSGNGTGSSNNTASITGPGSVWNIGGTLTVGSAARNNTLTITNGGVVNLTGTVSDAIILVGAGGGGSSNNSVVVTGSGSQLNFTNSGMGMRMGNNTPGNKMTISAGGVVNGGIMRLGDATNSINNTLTVDGTGSLLNLSDYLQIGLFGSNNTVNITNGGQINSSGVSTRLGNGDNSRNNAVIIDGAGSLWNNPTNNLVVGLSGAANKVTVSNGGQLNTGSATIGSGAGASNNLVTVDGINSLWINGGTGGLIVGGADSGNQLVVTNSGKVQSLDGLVVSSGLGTNNRVTIAGGSLFVTNSAGTSTLNVGRVGAGTLTLNGGTVTADTLLVTNGIKSVFQFNSGTLSVSNSTVANGNLFTVGNGINAARLHLLGGTNSFANGLTVAANASLTGNGSITGLVTVNGTLAIGNSPGKMNFNSGLTLGSGSTNVFEITDPSMAAGTYDLASSDGGDTVVFAGVLSLAFSGGSYTNGTTMKLFEFDSYNGSFTSVQSSGLDAGQNVTFDASTGIATVVAVPEPGTIVMVVLGCLSLSIVRRRHGLRA